MRPARHLLVAGRYAESAWRAPGRSSSRGLHALSLFLCAAADQRGQRSATTPRHEAPVDGNSNDTLLASPSPEDQLAGDRFLQRRLSAWPDVPFALAIAGLTYQP